MEKYGVEVEKEQVKVSEDLTVKPRCAVCGAPLETSANVPKCPQCGTHPWETAPKP